MNTKTKIFNLFRTLFKAPFLEKWLRQKTQNKSTVYFWCKLVPNNYQYQFNSQRTFTNEGVTLNVDIHDYVGHYLYFGFEDRGHEKLHELVRAGNTVLDIGTNIGSTILNFAKLVGKDGVTYGFEPDDYNFKQCQQNIALNSFKNIKVANIGLGNENGEFKLFIDTETNRGRNRIKLKANENKNFSIIKVKRLDDWIKGKELSKIDLIKIDVEGFETNVLKGGMETLKEHKPTMFIEVNDNNLKDVGSSAKELVEILESLNYKISNAETSKKINSTTNFNNCHYDIIVIPKTKK